MQIELALLTLVLGMEMGRFMFLVEHANHRIPKNVEMIGMVLFYPTSLPSRSNVILTPHYKIWLWGSQRTQIAWWRGRAVQSKVVNQLELMKM